GLFMFRTLTGFISGEPAASNRQGMFTAPMNWSHSLYPAPVGFRLFQQPETETGRRKTIRHFAYMGKQGLTV
ncbi:MAG: hypothetical protein KDA59_03215, partial [Planctomycetales bacterium]|nr:hypothetical protein [Planctomycetales bacterium]